MMTRSLLALLFATTMVAAQDNCPYERAKEVAASTQIGATVSCGTGIDLTVSGVQITSSSEKGCPLTVIITPTHDIAEPSNRPTRVVQAGVVPETVAFFRCVNTYFLIFVTGSMCELERTMPSGGVQQLRTEGCGLVDSRV